MSQLALTSAASAEAAPPTTEAAETSSAAAKKKGRKWNPKTSRGKTKLLRASEHWLECNKKNFPKMAEIDFTERGLLEHESPACRFRQEARPFELTRYFLFLFQMCLTFFRVWRPTKQQLKHYGVGLQSAGRRALLIMHSQELPPDSVTQLTSLRRHLFARVARESEKRCFAEKPMDKEMEQDAEMSTTYCIRDHISVSLLERAKLGSWPKLNLQYALLRQYEAVYKDSSKRKIHAHTHTRTVTSVL